MSSNVAPGSPESGVEWQADLNLEFNGRPAAKMVLRDHRCFLEIANLTAFKTLRASFADAKRSLGQKGLSLLAQALPAKLELVLHGIPVGHFEPGAPINWTAKLAGLPFGHLTIDKSALLRASIKGA